MTLLPCTSPYSFGLVVSSSFLGDLVNGVFSESGEVGFTVFGTAGTVAITAMQQEFGVTVAVSNQVAIYYFLCMDCLTFGLCFFTDCCKHSWHYTANTVTD